MSTTEKNERELSDVLHGEANVELRGADRRPG